MSSNTAVFVFFIYLFFYCLFVQQILKKIAYSFVTVSIKHLQLPARIRF